MRITAGLFLMLSACTTVQVAPRTKDNPPAPMPPLSSTSVRIGVEYLPPADDDVDTEVAFHAGASTTTDPLWTRPPEPPRDVVVSRRLRHEPEPTSPLELDFSGLQERWELSRENIRATKNTLERVALRFLSELIGDDHKRVDRAIGTPLLRSQVRLSSDPLSNYLDERDRQDHFRDMTKNGTRMVRRPLRNALKELPLFNDVEVAIRTIKTSNVAATPRSSRKFGRLSLRLRGGRLEDPVELAWIRGGFRVASSMEHLKASFSTNLLPNLNIRLRSRYNYEEDRLRLFGTLEYELSAWTKITALAGNRISLLSGLRTYPGGPQEDEVDKGMLVLVEHRF